MTKTCSKCSEDKPLEAFYRRRANPDGRAAICLDCGARDNGGRSTRRRERVKVDSEYAAVVATWGRDYRRRIRDERYGVPAGTVDAMFAAQGGRCAICSRTAEEVAARGKSGEQLHVDHCHASGVVRGLLCKKCNSALGLMDDDVERLLTAIEYLQKAAAMEPPTT